MFKVGTICKYTRSLLHSINTEWHFKTGNICLPHQALKVTLWSRWNTSSVNSGRCRDTSEVSLKVCPRISLSCLLMYIPTLTFSMFFSIYIYCIHVSNVHTFPFSRENPTRLQPLHGCARVIEEKYSNFSQVHSHLYAGNKSCLVTKIDVQLK